MESRKEFLKILYSSGFLGFIGRKQRNDGSFLESRKQLFGNVGSKRGVLILRP